MTEIIYPVKAALVGHVDIYLMIRRQDDSKETPYRKIIKLEDSSFIYTQLNKDEFTATISRGEDR